jgi:hypothetical protein
MPKMPLFNYFIGEIGWVTRLKEHKQICDDNDGGRHGLESFEIICTNLKKFGQVIVINYLWKSLFAI